VTSTLKLDRLKVEIFSLLSVPKTIHDGKPNIQVHIWKGMTSFNVKKRFRFFLKYHHKSVSSGLVCA